MGQMTNSAARVIDPILSEVARGYQQQPLAGTVLFPRVPVRQRGGKIITFGKEAFMQYANLKRAPGQNTRRIQFGYAGASYALEDFSLEGQVPYETEQEATAVPGIDLAQRTVNGVQDIIALRLEVAQATLATTAGNYAASNKTTLAGTAQWSDYSGTSDPVSDVEVGKEAVRVKTGKRPNTVVMGAAVFAKLKNHPKILDRIKYTGRDIPTTALLASLWDVEQVLVGDSVQAADDGTFSDNWGKFVVLAYTVKASLASQGTPTFGYTYQLEQMPQVEEPYVDRNAKSWIYPVTDVCAPVIAGAESGYLISAAVA
jgi:major capsid protein E